jgi:NADP-dependent 3-hydroxy acid dehydrogenase YdfG
MRNKTKNNYALITGGTSGIGQEAIDLFKDQNIPVIIT